MPAGALQLTGVGSVGLAWGWIKEREAKRPIVDHFWTRTIETGGIGFAAAEKKLQVVTELARIIHAAEGKDAADNVLHNGLTETILFRYKQSHEGQSALIIDDLHINYTYATEAMKKSEQIIGRELSYLDPRSVQVSVHLDAEQLTGVSASRDPGVRAWAAGTG